jgi:hypothetical protein
MGGIFYRGQAVGRAKSKSMDVLSGGQTPYLHLTRPVAISIWDLSKLLLLAAWKCLALESNP